MHNYNICTYVVFTYALGRVTMFFRAPEGNTYQVPGSGLEEEDHVYEKQSRVLQKITKWARASHKAASGTHLQQHSRSTSL